MRTSRPEPVTQQKDASVPTTGFPLTPGDVAPLTRHEFACGLDVAAAPPFAEVCERFANDANRAVVWLLRFKALQALKDDPRMASLVHGHSESSRAYVDERVVEVAAILALNEHWEFDAGAFFAAVEALGRRR
jgi:hypothetical protein